MKKLLILLLSPLMMFAQDSTLIGDVDCSGEVNSQDASLILQFVTNVIDELPCEANMTGLTPDQLQEMIDMMEDQLSINSTGCSSFGDMVDITIAEAEFFEFEDDGFLMAKLGGNQNDVASLYISNTNQEGSIWNNDIVMSMSDGENYSNNELTVPVQKGQYLYTYGNVVLYGFLPLQCEESITTPNNSVAETGGSGVNLNYPEGYNGEPITFDLSQDYVVPEAKNLYITNFFANGGDVFIDGIRVSNGTSNWSGNRGHSPFIASSGQIVSSSQNGDNNLMSFNGYLVDKTIEPITFDLSQDYVVPEGKNLYMTNFFANGGDVYIDGIRVSNGTSNWSGDRGHSPFIASSGQIVSSSQNGDNNLMSFNGYLVDEDYFSSAGSYDSSSSGNWNSTIPFFQSEFYPQGTIGESVSINFSNIGESYTVPAGKNLYIGQTYADSPPDFTISDDLGNSVFIAQNFITPKVFGEGFTITLSNCTNDPCSEYWSGKLIDKQYIEPVIIIFSPDSLSYTVPSGKVLVSLSYNNYDLSAGAPEWIYNGYVGPNGPSSNNPLEENQTITVVPSESSPTAPIYLIGYLINL